MASKKDNEGRVSSLNRLFGFKGAKYVKSKGSRTGSRMIGREFYLGGEYGRSYLGYRSAKSSKKISDNLTTPEMEEFLKGYRKGLTQKKSDFK